MGNFIDGTTPLTDDDMVLIIGVLPQTIDKWKEHPNRPITFKCSCYNRFLAGHRISGDSFIVMMGMEN